MVILFYEKLFAKAILKIIGWKVVLQGDVDNLDRCILVVAPHTHTTANIFLEPCLLVSWKKLKVIIKDAHTKILFTAGL
jgi:hypothetical protein